MTTSTTRIFNGLFRDKGAVHLDVTHKDYGGDPTGVTSLHTAIAAAAADLPTKGGVVYVPRGLYNLTASFLPPASHAFQDSSHTIIRLDPNAVIRPTSTTGGFVAIDTSGYVQADGKIIIEGGVLDLVNCTGAAATTAIGILMRSNNITIRDMTIMRCGADAIQLALPGAGFPLVGRIDNCNLYWNGGRGIYGAVGGSGLIITRNRIEQNGAEGILLDDVGRFAIQLNVIENNGRVTTSAAQVRLRNSVDGSVEDNYLESNAYQPNPGVLVEGVTSAPNALSISKNRFVGSYETSSGSGVALTAAVAIDLGGGGAGAIQGVVAKANKFFGQYSAVRIGTGVTGYEIGAGDQFTDNYANTFVTPVCPRYQRLTTLPGIVYDVNRHESKIYVIGATYQALLATSIEVTAGTAAAARLVKHATLGVSLAGATGSTHDFSLLTPGLAAIMQVPTGTADQVAAGHVKAGVAGKGFFVKEGTNARMGVSTLVAGTVVVSTTAVAANSRILLTNQAVGGTAGFLVVSARTAGTSFTILSSNAADTSTIAWLILEPA